MIGYSRTIARIAPKLDESTAERLNHIGPWNAAKPPSVSDIRSSSSLLKIARVVDERWRHVRYLTPIEAARRTGQRFHCLVQILCLGGRRVEHRDERVDHATLREVVGIDVWLSRPMNAQDIGATTIAGKGLSGPPRPPGRP